MLNSCTGTDEKMHKCKTCGKVFNRRAYLQLHEKIHGEKRYKCDICSKAFSQPSGLWIHKKHQSCLNKPSSQKPYKCIYCVKSFTQLGPLKQHCIKEHESTKIYECEVCKAKYEKYWDLASHKKSHLNDPNQNMSANDSIECTTDVKYKASSKQVSTNGCQSLGASVSKTGSHIFVKERNSKCDEIGVAAKGENSSAYSMVDNIFKSFSHKDVSLTEEDHMSGEQAKKEDEFKKSLLNTKKYKCSDCNREFTRAYLLKYHKRIHNGENPHSCTICDRTFRTPGSLTVHQRTHSGQKPYKCIFCFKGFTQRGSLLQHCRRIHYSDDIYECEVCEEKFEKYKDLSSHKQVHSDISYTMVKRTHDEVDFDDEEKLVHTIKVARTNPNGDNLNSPLGINDCDEDRKKRSTSPSNNTFPETSSSLSSRIKREIEDVNSSPDSGISIGTSTLDGNKSDENQQSDTLHKVAMEQIKMEVKDDEECVPLLWNSQSRNTEDVEFSFKEYETSENESNSSKENSFEMCASDEDTISSCSRVTTPENDHLFSSYDEDIQENSLVGIKLEEGSQLSNFPNIYGGQAIKIECHSCIKNDDELITSESKLVKNSKTKAEKFELNYAEVGLSDHPAMAYRNADVICKHAHQLYSNHDDERRKCESQTSNFPKLGVNQENFHDHSTFPLFEGYVTEAPGKR